VDYTLSPNVRQVQELAGKLARHGAEPPAAFATAAAQLAAIDAHYAPGRSIGDDLLALSPAEAVALVRGRAADEASRVQAGRVSVQYADRLAAALAAALAADSDRIIAALRPAFDVAAAGVAAAAAAGLQPGCTAADAIELGDAAVAAFRDLHTHRQTLGTLGTLRAQLSEVCGVPPHDRDLAALHADQVGPRQPVVACFLADSVPDLSALYGYQDRYDGNSRRGNGRDVGDRWMALACAGRRLTLNTGAPAQAVVDRAVAGTAALRRARDEQEQRATRSQAAGDHRVRVG